MEAEAMKMLAVGLTAGLGLLGPGLGIGLIGYSALQGIARNPEASGPIMTNMILVTAFCEAIGIYALIVAIILALIV
ncbi:MAG: ATP synthase F0 subunit C [Dehalococcoidia bacterium]|nr:MAG: ATP synthase F0 subunit C [Dehalococcoidia bacterium]